MPCDAPKSLQDVLPQVSLNPRVLAFSWDISVFLEIPWHETVGWPHTRFHSYNALSLKNHLEEFGVNVGAFRHWSFLPLGVTSSDLAFFSPFFFPSSLFILSQFLHHSLPSPFSPPRREASWASCLFLLNLLLPDLSSFHIHPQPQFQVSLSLLCRMSSPCLKPGHLCPLQGKSGDGGGGRVRGILGGNYLLSFYHRHVFLTNVAFSLIEIQTALKKWSCIILFHNNFILCASYLLTWPLPFFLCNAEGISISEGSTWHRVSSTFGGPQCFVGTFPMTFSSSHYLLLPVNISFSITILRTRTRPGSSWFLF